MAREQANPGGHYRRPSWFDRRVFNRTVVALSRAGISLRGARVLEVRGHKTGELRRVPVNVLSHEGERYLVAARGETQWARNLRAAGEGTLLRGRRREAFSAVEVGETERAPILRAYLGRWKWRAGRFFAGAGPGSTTEALAAIAADHPVFRIRAPGEG